MRTNIRPGRQSRRWGFTLVELVVTVAITAILLAMAVPQMREHLARKRVSGVATELVADIRYVRAQVLEQNQAIWISFGSTTDFSCYVIYTDGGLNGYCDCARSPGAVCDQVTDPPVELKSVYLKTNTGITLTSTQSSLFFQKVVGAPRISRSAYGPAEATVESSLGGKVKVGLAGPIRATICSASGHTGEFGACP